MTFTGNREKKTTSNKNARKRAILHRLYYFFRPVLFVQSFLMLASLPIRLTLLRPQRIATPFFNPLASSSSFMGTSMSSSAGNTDVAEFIKSENAKNQVCSRLVMLAWTRKYAVVFDWKFGRPSIVVYFLDQFFFLSSN